MAKTKSNFNMSKSSKMIIATVIDPNKRSELRRAMVDAEHAASIVPRSNKKEKFVTGTSTLE